MRGELLLKPQGRARLALSFPGPRRGTLVAVRRTHPTHFYRRQTTSLVAWAISRWRFSTTPRSRSKRASNSCMHGTTNDEAVLHGSSLAKHAAAFFRISRSSVTFLSSRFKRSTSLCSDSGLRPGPRSAVSVPVLRSCSCHL